MRKYITLLAMLTVMTVSLTSCQKDINTVYVRPDSTYTGRIQFVLRYNSAQDSLFYGFLQAAGLADTLSTPGPFTVFAPTNNALNNVFPPDITQYLVSGRFHLRDIPPGQTEILSTWHGYKILVNGYINGGDTAYTANGSLIQAADRDAANGVVQVLSRSMYYSYYPTCLKYINGNERLSIFAYALKRAHLDTLLNDSTRAYTVLAPDNTAFANAGITLSSLAVADPDSLAQHLVMFHILAGRLFLYDFLREFQPGLGDPQTISVPTLNGESLQVIISGEGLSDPTDYPVQFSGSNNPYPSSIEFYNPFDVPAGIGAVQVISAVLEP